MAWGLEEERFLGVAVIAGTGDGDGPGERRKSALSGNVCEMKVIRDWWDRAVVLESLDRKCRVLPKKMIRDDSIKKWRMDKVQKDQTLPKCVEGFI